MGKAHLLVVLLLCFCPCLTQTPPYWGGSPRFTVNASMLNNDPAIRWDFTYYYDWNLRASRY